MVRPVSGLADDLRLFLLSHDTATVDLDALSGALADYLIDRGVGKRGGRRRSRRERPECPEVGSAARRMIRALVRRAEEGDTESIEQLVETRRHLDGAITNAGRALHSFGYSFTELGDVLGTSRQAARERFTPRPGPVILDRCDREEDHEAHDMGPAEVHGGQLVRRQCLGEAVLLYDLPT